jgi:hypothetical protein
MNTRAYVLYDLQQGAVGASTDQLVAGAKKVSVAGQILGWKVGEFEIDPGKKIYGIKIRYLDSLLMTPGTQYVEVPAHAQNVHLHQGEEVPRRYEDALKATA